MVSTRMRPRALSVAQSARVELLVATGVVFFFLVGFSHSALSMILGTDVLYQHQFINRIDASAITLIKDDDSDTSNLQLGTNSSGPVGYSVNLNSHDLFIEFFIQDGPWLGGTNFSGVPNRTSPPPYINGLVITNDFLDIDAFIGSASIIQNRFQFTAERIIRYGVNKLALDFNSLFFFNDSNLQISFIQPTSVNEPDTVFLISVSLLGLAYAPRSRLKR